MHRGDAGRQVEAVPPVLPVPASEEVSRAYLPNLRYDHVP